MIVHVETRESWAVRRDRESGSPAPEAVCGVRATADVMLPGYGGDVYNYDEAVECIEGGRSMKAGKPAPCRECMQRVSLQAAAA